MWLIAPLVDAASFIALLGFGVSLRTSHIAAFVVGVAAYWLLNAHSIRLARGHAPCWQLCLRILAVALMALLLRGGVLALMTQRLGWAPQTAILVAIAMGMAVTGPGYSYALSAGAGQSRLRSVATGLIAYAFVLRLVFAASVELLPEEAYYWNYSQHLDFGYLDHPPMVAWLIRFGTLVFGQTEFGVRIGAICCGVVTAVFAYKLARNVFGEAAALAASLLTTALPFFFLAGVVMTPDAAMTAAWAASLYFLERALIGGHSNAWWRAGVALGLGMMSKYSIALLVPVTLVFMVWDVQSRRWWRRPEPYAAALLALAIFCPVIIWNAQHGWASFAFQTSRRLAEAPQFALHKLIGSLIVLITPTGVLTLVVALLVSPGGEVAADAAGDAAGKDGARRRRLLQLAILMPLSVFALFSLRHEVKLDWTGACMTAALPAMAWAMLSAAGNSTGLRAGISAAWPPTVMLMLLVYGGLLHYLVLGLPGTGYGKNIETAPVGWPDLTDHLIDTAAALSKQTGHEVLIVGMDRYAIASEVAFYGFKSLHRTVPTTSSSLFDGMSLMYGRWIPPESQQHNDLLLVAWSPQELAGASVEPHIGRLGPIEDDVLTRDGRLIRHYYHRFAYDYRSVAAE